MNKELLKELESRIKLNSICGDYYICTGYDYNTRMKIDNKKSNILKCCNFFGTLLSIIAIGFLIASICLLKNNIIPVSICFLVIMIMCIVITIILCKLYFVIQENIIITYKQKYIKYVVELKLKEEEERKRTEKELEVMKERLNLQGIDIKIIAEYFKNL